MLIIGEDIESHEDDNTNSVVSGPVRANRKNKALMARIAELPKHGTA